MSSHPNRRKNSPKKKISVTTSQKRKISQDAPNFLTERIILDLAAKANTPHEIMDHFRQVYQKDITYYAVRQVILNSADRIADIVFRFDLIAFSRIRIIEIDETFKGRWISFLVIVDADTGYLLYLHWLEKRTKEHILELLRPQEALFAHVQVVLTDGALYYPDVVRILCPDAIHQTCLIHVIRKLFPLIEPYENLFSQANTATKKCRESLASSIEQHQARIAQIKKFKQQIQYWETQRQNYLDKYQLMARKYGLNAAHPRLQKIKETLNEIRTKYRSMRNTLQSDKERLKIKKQDVQFAKNKQDVLWNQYMDQLHVLYQFYSLFQPNTIPFEQRKRDFITKIEKRSNQALAKEIIRILSETPNLGTIFAPNCPIKLTRQFINTNGVESANSRIRPILDKLRNWKDTEYSQAVLELLRLRLNASPPFNGPRKNRSPIERYGYNLRFRTWIDLIFEGLPPGPQSDHFVSYSKYELPIQALQTEFKFG